MRMSKIMNARCKIKASEDARDDPKVTNLHCVASDRLKILRGSDQKNT